MPPFFFFHHIQWHSSHCLQFAEEETKAEGQHEPAGVKTVRRGQKADTPMASAMWKIFLRKIVNIKAFNAHNEP